MNKWYAVNYNRLLVFNRRDDLINFFRDCVYGSEGHEQVRYMKILMEVYDKNIGTDIEEDSDGIVYEIVEHNVDGNKTISIDGVDYRMAIKKYESGDYNENK